MIVLPQHKYSAIVLLSGGGIEFFETRKISMNFSIFLRNDSVATTQIFSYVSSFLARLRAF